MINQYKHIVITGASSGIGEALACAYAGPGVVLSLTGRHEERLNKVAQACRMQGAELHDSVLDVTGQAAMDKWLKSCDDSRPVDLLIANAGISAGTGNGTIETPDQMRRLFDVNVAGVFNTIQPLVPVMMARGWGHIALMSSLAAFRGWPGAPGYCASKAAVKLYGEGLRGMLEGTGVSVSVICPGFVQTRMTDQNDYKMPFLISADKAARIIQKGLQAKKGRIAFPFPAHVFAWLFGAMPDGLAHKILKNTPAKNPFDKGARP